jgi:hypothetical protein
MPGSAAKPNPLDRLLEQLATAADAGVRAWAGKMLGSKEKASVVSAGRERKSLQDIGHDRRHEGRRQRSAGCRS